jgi:hypothetical protein
MAEFEIVDLSTSDGGKTWRWLESTKELQRIAFGWDWEKIHAEDRYPETLAQSFLENAFSAVVEIAELSDEFGWKPWAKPRGWVNREAALTEVVDIQHFLANVLVSIGVTDEEYETAYRRKQEENRRRQRDGYDGTSEKCPVCRRAAERDERSKMLVTEVGCWRDHMNNFTCFDRQREGIVLHGTISSQAR